MCSFYRVFYIPKGELFEDFFETYGLMDSIVSCFQDFRPGCTFVSIEEFWH